jgi:hypothetical protein
MSRKTIALALLSSHVLLAACASQSGGAGKAPTAKSKSEGTGSKVLSGVVVEREREAPEASSFSGTGTYYLIFEVRDGDATARYRYQVTYQQWFRYPEGSPVRITLRNNFLQDIRPDQ